MSKFDCMMFGISPGDNDTFVAHAKKYTKAEALKQCISGYDHLFNRNTNAYGRKRTPLRLPTLDDVQEAQCAFRFSDNPEFPDGAYFIVGDNEYGSFPVYCIDMRALEVRAESDKEDSQDA